MDRRSMIGKNLLKHFADVILTEFCLTALFSGLWFRPRIQYHSRISRVHVGVDRYNLSLPQNVAGVLGVQCGSFTIFIRHLANFFLPANRFCVQGGGPDQRHLLLRFGTSLCVRLLVPWQERVCVLSHTSQGGYFSLLRGRLGVWGNTGLGGTWRWCHG